MRLALLAAILVASWADVGYTLYAIRRYRVAEANGLWRWAEHRPVAFWIASTAFHAAVLAGLWWARAPEGALAASLAARLMVLGWNCNVIRRLK